MLLMIKNLVLSAALGFSLINNAANNPGLAVADWYRVSDH